MIYVAILTMFSDYYNKHNFVSTSNYISNAIFL